MPGLVSTYKRRATRSHEKPYVGLSSKKMSRPTGSSTEYCLDEVKVGKGRAGSCGGQSCWEIQVVTDIQVKIEGRRKEMR